MMQRIKRVVRNMTDLIKKYPYHTIVVVALVAIFLIFVFTGENNNKVEEVKNETRKVSTLDVSDYATGALGSFAPTAAGNTFVVRAQAGGQVDDAIVNGKEVKEGDILARLENKAQLASLTQAQGSYEAALASAARSGSSLTDTKTLLASAKQDAVEANRVALSTYINVLYNTVDQLFTNPRLQNAGVRINASGKAGQLNEDRYAMNTTISTWQNTIALMNSSDNTASLVTKLDQDIANIDKLSEMVDTFIVLLPKQSSDEGYSSSDIAALQSAFSTAKSTLNTERGKLQNAKTALTRAEEAVNSASFAASGSEVSSADAAIKQALGALQAAQASYEKTIVRAPFGGTVVSINVAVGDIINTGADVAIIEPINTEDTEKSFEIPLSAVKFTPTGAYVLTTDTNGVITTLEVETGLVTTSSINVSGLTGSEIIIEDIRGLKAGQVVSIN